MRDEERVVLRDGRKGAERSLRLESAASGPDVIGRGSERIFVGGGVALDARSIA